MDTCRIISLLLPFLLIFNQVICQKNYKEGYIVTNNNDTIRGYIRDGGGIRNSRYCLFKENENVKKYYPLDIKFYKVGTKCYASKKEFNMEKGKNYFVDVLLTGKLNLYYLRKNKNILYYLEKQEDSLIGLPYRIDNRLDPRTGSPANRSYQTVSNTYLDTLFSLFGHYKELRPQIMYTEYNHESLTTLTRNYLNLSCNNKNCITYIKDFKENKPTYGFFIGQQFSKIKNHYFSIRSSLISSLAFGAFYNAPVSLISDKLSIQVECIANEYNYQNDFDLLPAPFLELNISSQSIGIPLMIKYKLTETRFSPSIGIGKEFAYVYKSKVNYLIEEYSYSDFSKKTVNYNGFIHHSHKNGWFVDIGLDYKINTLMAVYTNIRLQSINNLTISELNSNHYTFSNAKRLEREFGFGKIYKTNQIGVFLGLKF